MNTTTTSDSRSRLSDNFDVAEPGSSHLPARASHQLPAVATPPVPQATSTRQLDVLAGAFMGAISDGMGFGEVVTGAECVDFARRFRSEAAVTGDPVEGLLLGQLTLANFAVGSLHAKAATATSAEDSIAYSAAASRLMAETRRMAETVVDIRRGGKPAVQLAVEQMNVAANGGRQQIAQVARRAKKNDPGRQTKK